MSRIIKFRRAHFKDEEKTQFSHFSEWGIGIRGSTFASPAFNNQAIYTEDQQFTGLYDKNGIEIYEGDIVAVSINHPRLEIVWDDFGWKVKNIYGHTFNINCQILEVIGHIYGTPQPV